MLVPLRSLAAALALALILPACASDDPQVKRVEVEVQTKGESLAAGSGLAPEPVRSTSLAIRMAELALREKGVEDADRRTVAVSYCDGIYTVTFERPEDQVKARDYVVEIDAATSHIVKVDPGR
ncbi:MAG: hypothetical protein ACK2U9_01415 [Anaerolineae bacterium]